MATHVLVPVDDSDPSDAALEFALEDQHDARITALHVIDPADLRDSPTLEMESAEDYGDFRLQQQEFSEQILDDAEERAREYGTSIETDQVVGAVADAVVEYADEHGVDRIVIGSHGRTGASRVLLGSVAETVARRAPVPVTIVR
ncbi:universal stress protein [Halopiger xanaduensis]|uniref:UspA domain-containing protein n=1 Tax=Halopiger xanaduensis (strain DSM 18323 / JCM 14033 / SH-6) TaxID=797210 RepID=F8D3F1_HALXS|nr:universal stress protein [Halopiger xanaduensis]AEH36177.1 UspA domain-containing protein [Halopiger xanaduensis SH-6]